MKWTEQCETYNAIKNEDGSLTCVDITSSCSASGDICPSENWDRPLVCARGGGGTIDEPRAGMGSNAEEYPFVCCNEDMTDDLDDESDDLWCTNYVTAGHRARYTEQCDTMFYTKLPDDQFMCDAFSVDNGNGTQANANIGQPCTEGNDDECNTETQDGLVCAHGPGGTDGPLGGDPSASDDVLYPYICCRNHDPAMDQSYDEWSASYSWAGGYTAKGAQHTETTRMLCHSEAVGH